jgi:hypothetical protein
MHLFSLALHFSLTSAYAVPLQHLFSTTTTSPSNRRADSSWYIASRFAKGSATAETGLSTYNSNQPITLSVESPLLTLDYGSNVAGFPVFQVASGAGQIEVKYSEAFDGLNKQYGDGLWTFVSGLMNTFRVETLNLTGPGTFQSALLQGGQRWQTVRLLTASPVVLSLVGFVPTVDIQPTNNLPGSFSSSNADYDGAWGLGAAVVQASCYDKGSQPATWNITADGALIPGQQPALCALGFGLSDYTLEFTTKIARGGTGWRVLSPDARSGPYFVVTSNYPNASTFVNTDRTLLPPNTLIAGTGASLVSQWILPAGPNVYYPLSMTIAEGDWYNITTVIRGGKSAIYINDTLVATVSTSGSGTWAFGPFMDQVAYVKDVTVTSSAGTLLYSSPMTSSSVLDEYGVNTNPESFCVDGAKRDRVVWTGDFAHAARAIAATTYRLDYVRGMIVNAFAWQRTDGNLAGLIGTQILPGASAQYKTGYYPNAYGITDYQLFFLVTLGDYYQLTADTAFLGSYWTQTKTLVARMVSYIDPYSGLLGASYDSFYFTAQGTSGNATAPTALFVLALKMLQPLATALKDDEAAASFNAIAVAMSNAINALLWNSALGAYSLSLSNPSDTSLLATAFTLRSGTASPQQAASSVAGLDRMFHRIGYKDTLGTASNDGTNLSPNTQGFLLDALFVANRTYGTPLDAARNMLGTFWPRMLNGSRFYTGMTWEYLLPDGSPGMGLFTSLAHPWGSAPTYVLTEYVLGVQSRTPGYAAWSFRPGIFGLGLAGAKGVVRTPHGNIQAKWDLVGNQLTLKIQGPAGTTGLVEGNWLFGSWTVNGNAGGVNGSISIDGGSEHIIVGTI